MADELVVKKLIVKVEGDTSDLLQDMKQTGKDTTTWSVALGNVIADGIKTAINGMVAAVKVGVGLAVGVMKTAVDDAISLESAFAGVVKTTKGLADDITGDLTPAGVEMQQAFRDMAKEIPQDVEALMGLGALGSQLGIQKQNLIGFTETMAMVGDATDLSSEVAAQAFAQISNVMGTSQEEISNMASALVELGNNMATTEPDIVNFAQRIAGAGAIAGLTEADVFGISAAFSSVGIQAEAGGTAVQKVLLAMNEAMLASTGEVMDNSSAITKHVGNLGKLEAELAILRQRETEWTKNTKESTKMRHQLTVEQKEAAIAAERELVATLQATHGTIAETEGMLEKFAAAAGVPAEEFAAAWETDAAGAFRMFVEGLGVAGDEAAGILSDLGLEDQRLIKAFLSLSGAGDLLSESIDMSSEAFGANTALADEAAARYRTTESQMLLFKNTIRDLSFELGGPLVEGLNEVMASMAPFIAEIAERLPGLIDEYVVPAIQWLVGVFGEFITFVMSVNFEDIWAYLQEMPAFKTAVDFIQTYVMPVFEVLQTLWEEGIPLAMKVISDYYETYLAPVFLALVEQWQTNIWPALAELLAFLKEYIPQAIAVLATWWDTILLPYLQIVADLLVTYVIPVLGQLVTWLIEFIPIALEALMTFWTETAWPAILATIEWFKENAWPIIETIVAWLVENVPIALEELRRIWQDVIWPAILEAVEWFKENALPIIEDIVEWFMVTLPDALEALRKVWQDDVWPAIEDAITAANNIIVPIFEELDRWINTNIVPWIEELQRIWAEEVWPEISKALEDAWEIIEPIWEDIQEWLDETIPEVIENVQKAWDDFWAAVNKAVSDAWAIIGDIFDKIKKFLDDLANRTLTFKIKLPDIPDWAMPGSPLPIHTAWKDFADWSRSASIEPSVSMDAVTEASLGVLGGVETTRSTTVNEGDNYNLEANYPYESEMSLIDQVRVLRLDAAIGVG